MVDGLPDVLAKLGAAGALIPGSPGTHPTIVAAAKATTASLIMARRLDNLCLNIIGRSFHQKGRKTPSARCCQREVNCVQRCEVLYGVDGLRLATVRSSTHMYWSTGDPSPM